MARPGILPGGVALIIGVALGFTRYLRLRIVFLQHL